MRSFLTTSTLALALGLSLGACSHDPLPPPGPPAFTPLPPATSAPTASATPATPSASAAPSASAVAAVDPDKPERDPDIEYVPTPQNVVDKMLDVVKVQKGDVL